MSVHLARIGALSIALASVGCYSITIVSGRPPAPSAVIEDKWRSSAAVDLVPIDSPINFEDVCKENGWAKIRQVLTPVDWFADLFLAGGWIYESTHVDVYCAKGSGATPNGVSPTAPTGAPPTGAPGTGAPPTPTMPPQSPLPPSAPPPGPQDKSL